MAYGENLKSQVDMLFFVDPDGFQIDTESIWSFSKEISHKS